MKTYDLTNPEESIWQMEQYYSGTNINNICGTVTLRHDVDLNILNKAINIFVKNNDSFSLNFKEENGKLMQFFTESEDVEFEKVSLKDYEEAKKLAMEVSEKPFDIYGNRLYKFVLYKLENGNGGFIVLTHHLISDGATLAMVGTEIPENYRKLVAGEEIEKKECSYADYIKTEKEYMQSPKFKKDKEYWNNLYSDIPEIASIPSKISKTNSDFNGSAKRKEYVVENNLNNKIARFCEEHHVSIFNFFMAIYAIYIGKVTNLDDFVIGTPILNRANFKEKQTSGMFINTAPLRIKLNHEMSFVDFTHQISKDSLSMLRYQKYSYQLLLQDLRKKHGNLPGLFDVMLSFQITTAHDKNIKIPYTVEWLGTSTVSDGMSIHLHFDNGEDNLNVAYDYQIAKYEETDVDNMHKRILHIINQVLENEAIIEKDIEIVTPEEKHQILYEFNNTKRDYPKNKTIIQLFEEQVKKVPDNIAVVFGDKKLTYRELNKKVYDLAYYLQKNNVKHGDIICMLFDKSLEMIVSILSLLKLGACYLPIDIDYPKDRIDYIIEDSKSKIVLSTKNISCDLPHNISRLNVDLDNSKIYDANVPSVNVPYFDSEDIAYIMYTSGSTGRPKGVIVNNINVVRLVKNTNFIKFSEHERILQTGSIVFDACTFEIWGALLNGFELYIIKKSELLDIAIFQKYLLDNKITSLFITTPLLMQLSEGFPHMFSHVKCLITGGDVLSPKHMNAIMAANPNTTIVHAYGPTENTTFSTCFTIDKYYTDSVPIGGPIANSTAYVVSPNGSLLPVGFPGELWVGGDGVALGYLNNPDLTKEKFIKNPFGTGMIYKTGDLVKWLPGGNIDFIGRIDNQVKIRGFRVELNEITTRLASFDNIKECTTIIRDIQNKKTIFSYFTSKDGNKIDINAIKNYLKDYLPSYMIPTHIYQLDKMPLNVNGKIDKKQLPEIIVENNQSIELPTNKLQKELLEVFISILHVSGVSITDSFFELGGDSLLAIKLIVQIKNKLRVKISIQELFENPSVAELSELISNSKNNIQDLDTIPKSEIKAFYPLSSAQKRIYLASKMDEASTLYNVCGGILLDDTIDIHRLQNVINEIISRHDVLRTCFEVENKQIVQKIIEDVDIKVEMQDVNTNDANELFYIYVSNFDLSKAPLFKVILFKLPNGKALLMLDVHHIIFDGTSLNNFINELSNAYNGEELPTLDISYKDFAVWENEALENDTFKESREFWLEKFQGEIPVLNMPTVYERPKRKSYDGKTYKSEISKEISEKINNFATSNNVTPYMVMLSCYYILLNKYSGDTDIIVGSPASGRLYKELEPLLGMFVNTVPLRNTILPNMSFKEFLQNVKETCLNSFEHQDYPFDVLVNDLKLPKDPSRSLLFDTMFAYQNVGIRLPKIGNLFSTYISPNTTTSKFDIFLEISLENERLTLSFEYCTKLFDEIFIGNFAKSYENILTSILENPEILIKDISIINNKENNLYSFNSVKLENKEDLELLENKITSNVFSSFTNENSYDTISVSPNNDIEKQVADVFKQLLPVSDIGPDDNFFDLGGDSLSAVNLQIELLNYDFKITYADIFDYPTVKALAKKISDNAN